MTGKNTVDPILTKEDKLAKRRAYMRLYRDNNRERLRAQGREATKRYRQMHKEEVREKQREWVASNRPFHNARGRTWRKNNPEKSRLIAVKYKYGIQEVEYKTLMEKSGGKCMICLEAGASHVDHCHSTGKVRGLLCRACNFGIGFFRDSVPRLKSAISYLESNI